MTIVQPLPSSECHCWFGRHFDCSQIAIEIAGAIRNEKSMSQILMLTDRPHEDERLAVFAAEFAHQLQIDGLAAVVTENEHRIPTGLAIGTPDGGLLPQMMPPSVFGGRFDSAAAKRLFATCHRSAAFYGLKCETARANVPLPFTAATLADFYGLVMLGRDTLLQGTNDLFQLRILSTKVSAPIVICPTAPDPCKRIFVATRNDVNRDLLIAWANHWSRKLNVPLTVIELSAIPSSLSWSALAAWKPLVSRNQRRQIIREGLLEYSFGPSDVLLVDRQPSMWRLAGTACRISLGDLIVSTACFVGVAPTRTGIHAQQILCPHESETVAA